MRKKIINNFILLIVNFIKKSNSVSFSKNNEFKFSTQFSWIFFTSLKKWIIEKKL